MTTMNFTTANKSIDFSSQSSLYIKDDASIRSMGNAGYVEKTGDKMVHPEEVSKNKTALAEHAINNAIGIRSAMPDLTKPLVETDDTLLDKQIVLFRSIVGGTTTAELSQAKDYVSQFNTEVAQKPEFDIGSFSNSRTSQVAYLIKVIIDTALESRKSTVEERNVSQQVAYSHGKYAADQKIQAGIDGRNNAITQGVVGSAMAFAGGSVSFKGLNSNNKAQMTHATESLKLKKKGDELSAQAMPNKPTKLDDSQSSNDISILRQTPERHYNLSQQEQIHLKMAETQAQKWQVAGGLASANANSAAMIVAAPGQVTQANSLANEQIGSMNKEVHTSNTEAKNKVSEALTQLIADFIQTLSKLQEAKSNTISTMTSNLKG